MRTAQGHTLQSLRAVLAFLDTHADVLGDVPRCGTRTRLDRLVFELNDHAITQSAASLASSSATQRYHALRTALLRDHMAPLAHLAAAHLTDLPELEPLTMPRGHPSVERLRAHAVGMAAAATPHAAMLSDAGLSPDFPARLVAAAESMVDAVGTRCGNRVARRGATEGLRVLLGRGRKLVHALDALVLSAVAEDSAVLAAWDIAKRVNRVAPRRSSLLASDTPRSAPSAHSQPRLAAQTDSSAGSIVAPQRSHDVPHECAGERDTIRFASISITRSSPALRRWHSQSYELKAACERIHRCYGDHAHVNCDANAVARPGGNERDASPSMDTGSLRRSSSARDRDESTTSVVGPGCVCLAK